MPTLKTLFETYNLRQSLQRNIIILKLNDLTPQEKHRIFFCSNDIFNQQGILLEPHRTGWCYLFDTLDNVEFIENNGQEVFDRTSLNNFAINILEELITPEVLEWIINNGNKTKEMDINHIITAIKTILARENIHLSIKRFLLFKTDVLHYSDFLNELFSVLIQPNSIDFFPTHYSNWFKRIYVTLNPSQQSMFFQFILSHCEYIKSNSLPIVQDNIPAFIANYKLLSNEKKQHVDQHLFRNILATMIGSTPISEGLAFFKHLYFSLADQHINATENSMIQRMRKTVLSEILTELPNILLQFNENQWTSDSFLYLLFLLNLFVEEKEKIPTIKGIFKQMQAHLAEMPLETLKDYSLADEQEEKNNLITIILEDLKIFTEISPKNPTAQEKELKETQNARALEKLKDYLTIEDKQNAQILIRIFKNDLMEMKMENKQLDDYIKQHSNISTVLSRVLSDHAKITLAKLRHYTSLQERYALSIQKINASRSEILTNFAQNPRLCLVFMHHLNHLFGDKKDLAQYNLFITLYHKPDSYLRTLLINTAIYHEELFGNSMANYLIDSSKDIQKERTRSSSFSFKFLYEKTDRQHINSKIKHLSNEINRTVPIPDPFTPDEIPEHLLMTIDKTSSTSSTPLSNRVRTYTSSSTTSSLSPFQTVSKTTLPDDHLIKPSPLTLRDNKVSTSNTIPIGNPANTSKSLLSDSSNDDNNRDNNSNDSTSTTSTIISNKVSTPQFSSRTQSFFPTTSADQNNSRNSMTHSDDGQTDDDESPFKMDNLI